MAKKFLLTFYHMPLILSQVRQQSQIIFVGIRLYSVGTLFSKQREEEFKKLSEIVNKE